MNITELHRRVARGEITPEQAAEAWAAHDTASRRVRVLTLAALTVGWIVFISVLLNEVVPQHDTAALREQLGECLKKQPYVQCTAVDATHDLCERRVK